MTINTMCATRNLTNVERTGCNNTEFQMHISQQAMFSRIHNHVFDYTEKRLIKCIENATSDQQSVLLTALLEDYCSGNVAVAWRRGEPVYVRVTKNR